MTATLPAPAHPAMPRLRRWKLTEPLRLYVYGWALILEFLALFAAAVSGFWLGPVTVAAVALLLVPAVEFARASTYSPRSMLHAVLQARQ